MVMLLQIVVSLGPVSEFLQGRTLGGDDGAMPDSNVVSDKDISTADVLVGAVQVQPDRLSCGQMLLAAVRTLASQKIVALATDLEEIARQLGWVFLVLGMLVILFQVFP